MANTAKTQEFFIGDLDIRVSNDLTKAGKLGPLDTIGLLQDAKVTMTTNQAKLQASFPQKTYATAVTSREMSIEGNLNEYSISNLALIYGDNEAVSSAQLDTATETTCGTAYDVSTPGTDLAVADATGLAADDTVYIYDPNDPSDVMVMEIASISTNTITFTLNIPRSVEIGWKVSKVVSIKLGSSDNIPPLTIQVVGVMPLDNSPFVYDIWKGTISGSAEVASSTDKFGALAFKVEPLQPTAIDISGGKFGADAVTKALVKKFPMGRMSKKLTV